MNFISKCCVIGKIYNINWVTRFPPKSIIRVRRLCWTCRNEKWASSDGRIHWRTYLKQKQALSQCYMKGIVIECIWNLIEQDVCCVFILVCCPTQVTSIWCWYKQCLEVFQETAIYITDSRWWIKLEFQSVLLDSHLHIFCNEHDHVCCSVSDQAEESPPEETLASFPLSKSLSGSHDEDALFKERLRNMGKSIYFDTWKRIIDYILSSHQMSQLSG